MADFSSDGVERRGAVTTKLWQRLMGDRPPPTPAERAAGLVLSFEATDYTDTRYLWNFCQSRPAFNVSDPESKCYSNDKTAFLTWGPRGATAGHGREVQAVLELVRRTAPELIEHSFGTEAPFVLRMITLENDNSTARDTSLEHFLCGVWLDTARRAAWRDGFRTLGADPRTQSLYQSYYASRNADGGKIEIYLSLYRAAGLSLSELDYGFVLDRATHMSAPNAAKGQQILSAWADVPSTSQSNARFRQLVSATFVPSNLDQRASRFTRDAAFFVDVLDQQEWTEAQRAAWFSARGQATAASAVGLSDAATAPAFVVHEPSDGVPPSAVASVTDEERALCPTAVLSPVSPARR